MAYRLVRFEFFLESRVYIPVNHCPVEEFRHRFASDVEIRADICPESGHFLSSGYEAQAVSVVQYQIFPVGDDADACLVRR